MSKRPFNSPDAIDRPPQKRTRFSSPAMPGSMPGVNGLVVRDPTCRRTFDRIDADSHDPEIIGTALRVVFDAVVDDENWRVVLDPAFHVRKHCLTTVAENARLTEEVIKGLRTQDWQPL